MASRQIIRLRDGGIKKIVPAFDEIKGAHFPNMAVINSEESREEVYSLLENASELCKSAVIQQYNEYLIYEEGDSQDILAPIQFVSIDERGLPILGFPYFSPLAKDDVFYKFTDEENYVGIGLKCAEFGVKFEEIRNFMEGVHWVCDEYGLREDDIFFNLSNIGYNPKYGLRVIDYGLVRGYHRQFELVSV